MKKFLLHVVFSVLICGLAVSCGNNNDSDEVYMQSFDGCYGLVENTCYKQVGYKLEYNYTKKTATVSVTNIQLPNGMIYPTMVFADIPFTIKSDGWIVISANNVTPSINGFGSVPTASEFSVNILNRDFDGLNFPGFCMQMNISGYNFVSAPLGTILVGTTNTTEVGGPTSSSKSTTYIVEIVPESRTLNIVMSGAKFIDSMPAMDITLESIPFTFEGTVIRFNAAEVTPKIGNDPFPAFPITNLTGTYDLKKGMDMSFHCAPRTTPSEYDVVVSTDYSF